MTPEAHDALTRQLEAFRKKFGREPGPDDPVFFDPDADTPQPLDPGNFDALIVQAMVEAGIDPAAVYAYRKTGLIVTQENQQLIPEEQLEEWEAAIAEYEVKTGGKPS